jgi:hypothetical protein
MENGAKAGVRRGRKGREAGKVQKRYLFWLSTFVSEEGILQRQEKAEE